MQQDLMFYLGDVTRREVNDLGDLIGPDEDDFTGRAAIVTGAAGGIGAALAWEFAGRGAAVLLADNDEQALAKQAAGLAEVGHRVVAVPTDVSRREDVDRLIDRSLIEHGRLDFMVNNSTAGPNLPYGQVMAEDWRRVIAINLWSAIYGTDRAFRVMAEQGRGHILNVVSAPAAHPYHALDHTTMCAVVGLSTALRAEAARDGVRVSVACPAARSRTTASPAIAARAMVAGVVRNDAVIALSGGYGRVSRRDALLPRRAVRALYG
jgi:NAD(P)-dependent dehydrogenase (short-subunit alcohol dehydrogenase family)